MPDNPQIDIAGNKWWYNEEGDLHCLDRPAVIQENGTVEY